MYDLASALFQCEARTKVLGLLLVEQRVASVSELARRAGLTVRAVAKEVEHLAQLHLVKTTMVGAARVVEADRENPACALLTQLLTLEPRQAVDQKQEVRQSLVAYGAPLAGVEPARHFTLEATLLHALEAARTDGTLLRVLPVVIAKNRHHLDWRELKESARKRDLKAELGLLLELTGSLVGDATLTQQSVELKDRRRTKLRYFTEPRSKYERASAEQATPPLARSWGFYMNTSEESFRSLIAKCCPELKLS